MQNWKTLENVRFIGKAQAPAIAWYKEQMGPAAQILSYGHPIVVLPEDEPLYKALVRRDADGQPVATRGPLIKNGDRGSITYVATAPFNPDNFKTKSLTLTAKEAKFMPLDEVTQHEQSIGSEQDAIKFLQSLKAPEAPEL